jgi:hypothetical protein
MNSYIITDADGNWVNTIVSTLEFAQEAYPNCTYTIEVEPEVPTEFAQQIEEQEARQWRDDELAATDEAAKIPDWPNRANILVYRQDLRDWPSTQGFPDTRPELGE